MNALFAVLFQDGTIRKKAGMSWWGKHVTKNVSKAAKQVRKSVTGTMRNIEHYTGIDEINRATMKSGVWDTTGLSKLGIDGDHLLASKVTEEYWRTYQDGLNAVFGKYTTEQSFQDAYDSFNSMFEVDEYLPEVGGEQLTTTSNETDSSTNMNKVRNARLGAAYSLGNTNSQAGQRRTGGYVGGRTTGGYGGKKD